MSTLARAIHRETLFAGEDVKEHRFVNVDAEYPANDGDASFGVTDYAAKEDEAVAVVTDGTATVEVAAAVSKGREVMSDDEGKAIHWTSGQIAAGIALEAAAADGDKIRVKVFSRGETS
ncbi:MAG: DUF2190 family protein [Holophagales bacterium]|nr:DUF2190 family protein [Holophagales bacterium]MYB20853.1 DUF2190 family protein [Holophagales bacterium]MYD22002.1 DUF2190 family protein [Holophagales bacterium]MYH25493.1 DUF2190 family protein [Holophagales bacterium]MYI34455.1 DUF2190 family protein [Holophagales bacterium]